jgi:phosphonoacetate hydrolase
VVHHGALGSFAWVHLAPPALERAREILRETAGIEEVYTREEAAIIFEHPPDRIGDLSVTADAATALGSSQSKHDLSAVDPRNLRSHGGHHEQIVPIIVSQPLTEPHALRHAAGVANADIHDLLLNGTTD